MKTWITFKRVFLAVMLPGLLVIRVQADLYVRNISSLPIYMNADDEHKAWMNENLSMTAFRNAGVEQNDTKDGEWTMRASTGNTAVRMPALYSFGDVIAPPELDNYRVDWDATISGADHSVTGKLVCVPSVNAAYFIAGGKMDLVWHYVDLDDDTITTAVTQTVQVSDGPNSRPYRLYWTEEPYQGPAVSLFGKNVQFYFPNGSELKMSQSYVTTNENGQTVSTNSYGLYVEDNSRLLRVIGEVEGLCLMQYTKTGAHKEQVGLDGGMIVVQVMAPEISTVNIHLGDEIRPRQAVYATAHGGLMPKMVSRQANDEDVDWYFTFQQDGAVDRFYAVQKSVSAPWNLACNWFGADEMGTEWPFEMNWYSADWNYSGAHPFICSTNTTYDPGIDVSAFEAQLMDYQVPTGHIAMSTPYIHADAAMLEDAEGQVGFSLLGITTSSNMQFLTLRSEPYTSLRQWPLAEVEMIGNELLPQATAASLVWNGGAGATGTLQSAASREFMMEMWVRREHRKGGELFRITDQSTNAAIRLYVDEDGSPYMSMEYSGNDGQRRSLTSEPHAFLMHDTWFFVSMQLSSNGASLLVNGRSEGDVLTLPTGVLRPILDEPALVLGDGWHGYLDDIRVWSGSRDTNALSQVQYGMDYFADWRNEPALAAYYPIMPEDAANAALTVSNYIANTANSDLSYGADAVIVPAAGAVGFSATPQRYPDDTGFVYEPDGTGYNAGFHKPSGNIAADDGPIFAINNNELNVWWHEKIDIDGQALYIPGVSQTFTNQWPPYLRSMVLAAGNGSANTSRVYAGQTMRFLGGEDAGIMIPRDLRVLGSNGEFTFECWFKPDENDYRAPLFSFAHNTMVLYGRYDKVDDEYRSAVVYLNENGGETVIPGPGIESTNWNYLAVVYENGVMKIYDSSMTATSTAVAMDPVSDYRARLNRVGSPFASTNAMPMLSSRELDEVRLWNYARNTEQLQEHMGTQLSGNEAGLKMYFSFDVSKSAEEAYDLAYKAFYPAEETLLVSPGVWRHDRKVYGSDEDIEVYTQNDTNSPGYHPNDEHAFIYGADSEKVVYALRDDLSALAGDSNNVVIVNVTLHEDEIDFYSMDLFEVVRTNEVYTQFLGQATAGATLDGPSPLQLLPNPNTEKTGLVYGPGFRDRKLAWWALAATDTNVLNEQILTITNYYPMQSAFWFPGLTADKQPAVGTPIPWLPHDPAPTLNDIGDASYPTAGTPIEYNWEIVWPEDIPEMKVGQTLTKAVDELPEMWSQASVDVLWQTSTNVHLSGDYPIMGESVLLFDPTVARGIALLEGGLAKYGFEEGGAAPSIYLYQGLTYFADLPPDLKDRVYYDPAGGEANLLLKGEYVDNPAGNSWLYVNVLSTAQVAEVLALAPEEKQADWAAAIGAGLNALTNPVPARPNTPVDHYGLAALGEGAGYVTVAFNNSTNTAMVPEGDPISLAVIHVDTNLYLGEIMPIQDEIDLLSEEMNMLYTESIAGRADQFEFDWKFNRETESGVFSTNVEDYACGAGLTRLLLGGAGSSMNDQVNRMFTLRYRARTNSTAASLVGTNWSDFVEAKLSEGWAERVLNALTPFEQRMRDLYDNPVETAVTMIQQAGAPYEGDVALNMNNMDSIGLLQLYRTLQNRLYKGMPEHADAAAQKQMLLSASRLNDLYMVLGDEAYVDAMDPTVQYGYSMTSEGTSLNIDFDTYAGSLFCFENQVASLLDEELALLRGRDGATYHEGGLQPPVTDTPYFNRLPWNFTKGLMAGEVAYAMNYNVQGADQAVIDEETAAVLFPQGHGDAWGYYLLALRQYMDLIRRDNYSMGPGVTAMDLGGNPVNIGYYDENKCAESAAALARTGTEILRRVRRKGYAECDDSVFPGLYDSNTNRAWGVGEWAARAGEGAYMNWVLANSMLPAGQDFADMTEGMLTNITRETASGLGALKAAYSAVQQEIDSADARLNPLGLSDNSIPFDISPAAIDAGQTHFEQILTRAEQSLENADKALEHAQSFSLTRRQNQQNGYSLADSLADEEAAWTRRLIEIYGYPYSDDIGPGQTYAQAYDGPDLLHWMYMDLDDYFAADPLQVGDFSYDTTTETLNISLGDEQFGFAVGATTFDFMNSLIAESLSESSFFTAGYIAQLANMAAQIALYVEEIQTMFSYSNTATLAETIHFHVRSDGIPVKPSEWTGMRRAEGELQTACADLLSKYFLIATKTKAINTAITKMTEAYEEAKTSINLMIAKHTFGLASESAKAIKADATAAFNQLEAQQLQKLTKKQSESQTVEGMGDLQVIVGFSDSINAPQVIAETSEETYNEVKKAIGELQVAFNKKMLTVIEKINSLLQSAYEKYTYIYEIHDALVTQRDKMNAASKTTLAAISDYKALLMELQQAQQKIYTLQAEAERVQEERERVRTMRSQQVATLRYTDMLMRVFQNDAIRQYQSLFDRAAQQAYLAAKAYAYETAMSPVDTQLDPGYQFLNQIVQARTIGALDSEGNPMSSGDIGDGGLANVLARLKANWAVLDGRLGFNNPEVETGRFSLRQELFRILPGEEGNETWRRTLRQYWVEDLYAVPEFSMYCIPFAGDEAQVEPGLVIPFSSDVSFGNNFFGNSLAGGDNAYDSSHFATKIRSLGIWFSDYNTGTNYNGLANNPRVYLVPAGQDIMRTPDKLAGETIADDGGLLSTWNVMDQALEVPYPIGDTELDDKNWIPLLSSSAGEIYRIRRYPSLRAYHDDGDFDNSEMISNARLIGRSVWNTRWVLIIPAGTLNTDRDKGLDYFIDGINGTGGVSDIKLMFKTYSYAGN